jgi:lipopolysaccharide transport system permease protein
MTPHDDAARLAHAAGHLIDTLHVLVGREFRIRYKGSFFGILWAVLSPLGTVVILQFVFSRVMTIDISDFSAFIYSGLLPWVWFSSAVQTGAMTLTENRDLVRTPFFSKPLLPCAVTCTNFLLYLFAFPVLLLMLTAEGIPLTRALVALPVIWMVQGILTLGATIFIAAVGLLVRDVQHLMGVLLLFWFYLTPIFYGVDQVPSAAVGWFALNPMTPIVSAHRDVTLYGRFPNWSELGYWAGAGGAILAVSLLIFRSLEDTFIDEA